MGGIAGILDLAGQRPLPEGILRRMSAAMRHRGPDGEGIFERPGVGLVWRQLATFALEDNCQPAANEDQSVHAVLHGALYNGDELRADLQQRGHTLRGRGDAHALPHLWEEYGQDLFPRLKGQFAVAFWDQRRRQLVLARDRFGICPLHWTRQGDWLLFASEIKTLLASGLVPAKPDLRGISQVFTFFGLPGPITCFQNVSSLLPGHHLSITSAGANGAAAIHDRLYWQMDFPDAGQEDFGPDQQRLVEEYEAILLRAVQRRLRADAPVMAYSSGGLDSSMLVAMARRIRGEPLSTFTFRIEHPTLKESAEAEIVARHVGTSAPSVVDARGEDIIGTFPRLVEAAESPVIDTSAAALFLLAEAVHGRGGKVVLTGEGADEWQAGYPWFRIDKKVNYFNRILPLGRWGYWAYASWVGSRLYPRQLILRSEAMTAGHNSWLTAYHLMRTSHWRFFSRSMQEAVGDYLPYDDLQLNTERMRRWDPMNRSVYMGARIHLAGLHLHARGDRSSMHASVENRYPFLDEDLFDFLARLHPRWKLRGLEDKFLQRLVADRWLPPQVIRGRKRLLHAPLEAFHRAAVPAHIEELLSERALNEAGYFDPKRFGIGGSGSLACGTASGGYSWKWDWWE